MRSIVILASMVLAPAALTPAAFAQTPAPKDVAASVLRALDLDRPNPLAALFGQRAPFVTTEGDYVVVHMPVDVRQPLPTFVADDLTLRGRAIGDGRWWFDRASLPSTVAFGDASAGASVRATLRTDGLSYDATFDPTYATENVAVASLPSLHAHVAILDATPAKPAATGAAATAASAPIEFDIDTGVLTTSDRTTPAVGGFVRDSTDAIVDHVVLSMPGIALSARVKVGFVDDRGDSDISPEAGRAVTAAYNGFLIAMQPSPDKTAGTSAADLAPASLSQMKTMLHALRSALRSLDSRTEADDIDVDLGDGTAPYHLDRLMLAGRVSASQGLLDVATELEFDGLRVPGLPAGYARLMPRHVLIRPHLGGVDIDDLVAAAGTMLDNLPGGEAAGEVAGRALVHKLAAEGKLSIGLDTIAVDVDGASLVGSGTIRLASDSPAGVSATADVRVTGIDAVTAELAAHAETKDALAPLAFLKGLGRQDGTVMTWHIDFSGGKLMVNGQDLTAMFTPPH